MQIRELSREQYRYLKEVLGVETVLTQNQSKVTKKSKVILLSAPASSEEKQLLAKITEAFRWPTYETIVADNLQEPAKVEELFIFGSDAKNASDRYLQADKAILAPSLAVLLHDANAKKTLWQQMKQYMEN
jgi:DNA polymerase III psi subunit